MRSFIKFWSVFGRYKGVCFFVMACIKNIEDIKSFFLHLYEERKVVFHPEDPFDEYVCLDTGKPSFTPNECDKYNSLMDECFNVCEVAHIDIYEIACELRDNLAVS